MNTSRKSLSGVAGTVLIASGVGFAATSVQPATAANASASADAVHEIGDYRIESRWAEEGGALSRLANVQGSFSFNQQGVTPNDELFNVFGTAILSMCSKPALDIEAEQVGEANYYVNVGGSIEKSFTVNLAEMDADEKETLMGCSCATGSPFGQARVVGVELSKVVGMADLEEGVNTLTAYGSDGYGEPLPLQYVLDKHALLVYRVNGEELKSTAEGSSVQLWMPETVARYFTRNITQIELTCEEEAPEVGSVDPMYRNKIEIKNDASSCEFEKGKEITFEGVADDCGSAIEAVEFSFDGGQTWTVCGTEGVTADKWVNWQFTTTFADAGDYEMIARARTADGVVSPLVSSLSFSVV
ncbi:MAG: molybdopterin-dependent oxidoreductase [Gordonibacter sp.]